MALCSRCPKYLLLLVGVNNIQELELIVVLNLIHRTFDIPGGTYTNNRSILKSFLVRPLDFPFMS